MQERCESIDIPRDAVSASTLQGEKNSRLPRGIPLEAGPVGIMGKMAMPRQARIRSLSSSSLRLCVIFLFLPPPPQLGTRPRLRGYIVILVFDPPLRA